MLRQLYIGWIGLLIVCFAAKGATIPAVLIQNYSVKDYKASCQNWDLSVSYNGFIYAANNSGLLSFDGNNWQLHEMPDKSELYHVTYWRDTLYTKGEESMGYWLRDAFGLLHYTPVDHLPPNVKFEKPEVDFVMPEAIQRLRPTAIAAVGDLFFIGTAASGLVITNKAGEVYHHLTIDNQLQDNIVRAICVQDNTLAWIALDNGITRIEVDPPIAMLDKRQRIGKLEDAVLRAGKLYIQTNRGFYSRELEADESFEPIDAAVVAGLFPTQQAAEGLVVTDLFTDLSSLQQFAHSEDLYARGDDHYWLTTQNEAGLFQLKGGKGILKCRILFTNYNLNLVSNDRRFIPLNDSLDLVSTMEGALLVHTRKLIAGSLGGMTMPNCSRIHYIDKRGTHAIDPHTQVITLPHHFQELSVYAGTTVFTPNHQISYRLEGVSDEWSEWQNEGVIKFLQLPPGEYQLVVRKYVARGPFPEFRLKIEVRSAWYNTLWAYLLYALLLGVAMQVGLRIRLANLKRKEEAQREAERIAEQQRLQQLKSEMLEVELKNKSNELTLQTTALVKRNEAIQSFLKELDEQKSTLGDRYPNKLYNRLRKLMEDGLNNQADWLQFESYFNNAHHNFMERLRQRYADITMGDLRLCCLLRMILSTKEIASLLNVSVRAIEIRRYRLRKRLMLESDTNLVDFLLKFGEE